MHRLLVLSLYSNSGFSLNHSDDLTSKNSSLEYLHWINPLDGADIIMLET